MIITNACGNANEMLIFSESYLAPNQGSKAPKSLTWLFLGVSSSCASPQPFFYEFSKVHNSFPINFDFLTF